MTRRLTTAEAMQNPAIARALAAVEAKPVPMDGADEATVMREIVEGLRLMGYRTPRDWKPGITKFYIRAGQRRANKAGSDAGCPDILVSAGKVWLGFEAKARTKEARPSQEQKLLAGFGLVTIVNCFADVWRVVEDQQ